MLRRHQAELNALCEEIKLGRRTLLGRILCPVVPGGGKSMLPLILAAHLLPAYADKLCWVVPRLALQHQAECEFVKPSLRRLLNHHHELRQSTNDIDPSRGLSGYITTYQAISQSPDLHTHEFSRHRYVLVLDEPHHVEEGGAWERALSPLVDAAALVIFMSGTMERGNGQRVAFLSYRLHQGIETLDLSARDDTAVIRYTRADALAERAVIPMFFRHFDAQAEWLDGTGQTCSADSLATCTQGAGQALLTALSTNYAFEVLDAAAGDWQAHRRQNPRAKLLVVSASVAAAREYVRHLKASGVSAEIATSLESEQALQNIARFRQVGAPSALDVLVTVQMAYEGLDVPSITHIACLTHIRSRPWIEQMLARATRYDSQGPRYEEQAAYIYVPDDPMLLQIIHDLTQEQAPFVTFRPHSERDVVEATGVRRGNRHHHSIVPCASSVTRQRASEVNEAVDLLSYAETERIQEMMQRHGLVGLSPVQLKRVFDEVGVAWNTNSAGDSETSASDRAYRWTTLENLNGGMPESEVIAANQGIENGLHRDTQESCGTTASEREKRLRQAIQKYCSGVDSRLQWEHGATNRLILQAFGKSRETMTVPVSQPP